MLCSRLAHLVCPCTCPFCFCPLCAQGMCYTHAVCCGAGTGLFFLPKNTRVLVMRKVGGRAAALGGTLGWAALRQHWGRQYCQTLEAG